MMNMISMVTRILNSTFTARLAGFLAGAGEVIRAAAFYSVAFFFSYPYAATTAWQLALVAIN
jgi:hypothetical protein